MMMPLPYDIFVGTILLHKRQLVEVKSIPTSGGAVALMLTHKDQHTTITFNSAEEARKEGWKIN
jgi:hypothetical protein